MLSQKQLFLQQSKILQFLFNASKRNCFKSVNRPDFSKLKLQQSKDEHIDIAQRLTQKIKLSGPITVADYMKEVLTNSVTGYYMNKDMFGEHGDFITSPEISQLFGEMLGIWYVAEWQKLGSPKPFQIVEFGPGRGTLLKDILKVLQRVGVDKDDFSIHLIEISPTLQRLQAHNLCATHKVSESDVHYHEGETLRGSKVYWYRDLKHIPTQFGLYLAHEFFDALPVHKFKKTETGWREILIDLDSDKQADIKFRYVISRDETVASKLYVPLASQGDDLTGLEVCPQAIVISQQLGSRIDENGGIGLIVDYGDDKPNEDSFRAFKQHKQVDPLTHVGSADLTADVDFRLLKKSASNAKIIGPVTQRNFLQSIQSEVRLQILLDNAPADQHETLKAGFNTLIDPDKMGNCFKFMGLFPTITDDHYKKFPIFGFDNIN